MGAAIGSAVAGLFTSLMEQQQKEKQRREEALQNAKAQRMAAFTNNIGIIRSGSEGQQNALQRFNQVFQGALT